jgi:hypothetical protein
MCGKPSLKISQLLQEEMILFLIHDFVIKTCTVSPLRIVHVCRNENFCNRYLSFYWKKWFYIWYMAFAWWIVPCLPFPGLPHIYFLFTTQLRMWFYSELVHNSSYPRWIWLTTAVNYSRKQRLNLIEITKFYCIKLNNYQITLREPCNNQRPRCDIAWLKMLRIIYTMVFRVKTLNSCSIV